jgi:hypothetical protein
MKKKLKFKEIQEKISKKQKLIMEIEKGWFN